MSNQLTGRSYLQKLQIFAYGTLAAPLLFFIYLYLESSVDRLESLVSQDTHHFIFILVFLIDAFLFFLSLRKFRALREAAISKEHFVEKLELYQRANNFRFVVYGAIASLCTIGFYLTNYQPFAALFGVMIVFFSISNPTARKIVSDLRLKDKEKQTILTGLEIT